MYQNELTRTTRFSNTVQMVTKVNKKSDDLPDHQNDLKDDCNGYNKRRI